NPTDRLGWNQKPANTVKDHVIAKRFATFEPVTTPSAVVKILSLTTEGEAYLDRLGVTRNRSRRGGAAHEYWKWRLGILLRGIKYTVTAEAPVGAGKTVDLHATRGDRDVWFE